MPRAARESMAQILWSRVDLTTIRARGRWVISWQAFVIGATLHAFLVGATGGSVGAEATPIDETPYWLALAVLASGLVGAYALLVNYTAFRYKRVRLVPLWQVIAFHAGVGCIFAATLLNGDRLLPVTPIDGAAPFAIATVAIGVWFGFTMSFLLEARDRYHDMRSELIEESVVLEMASISGTEAAVALARGFREELESSLAGLEPLHDELAGLLEQVREESAALRKDTAWRAVAHRLREATDEAVRPLSRELWVVTEQAYPNPLWREIFVDTLRTPIAAAGPTAAIVFIGYLRACMTVAGVGPGVVLALALAATIGGLLLATSHVRRTQIRSIAYWLVFVVSQIVGVGVVLLGAAGSGNRVPTEIVGSLLAMTISILAPSAVATLNAARSGVLSRLRGDAARERARQVASGRHLARLAQETAAHLHGTVQTSMIACAAAIELAVDSDDPQQLHKAMERAVVVVGSVSQLAPKDEAPLCEVIYEVTSAWHGLVDVDVEIDSTLMDATGQRTHLAGRIVEECLANAVRHGEATNVNVRIDGFANEVRIIVEDNGGGMPEVNTRSGLGTAVLVEATGGRVTFEASTSDAAQPGLRVTAVV